MKLRHLGKTLILALGLGWVVKAQIPDFTPPTPLLGAVLHNDTMEAQRLLSNGADPNEGQLIGFPPAFLALIY
jgi:hypothetical protein